MPTISIIITTYNAEFTILETIKSVLEQTFSDFELIVIDDGSTDRTIELVHSIADERVRLFSYENGGVAVARNRGISHATGDFIAFLDHDDLWTSDKLELQLTALQQHQEAGVAYSWSLSFMDEKKESFYVDEHILFEGDVYEQFLVSNFIISASNPLIRKQAIESVGEFDPLVPGVDDWDYWIRLAAQWPFAVVPKPLLLYRQSPQAQSCNIEMMEKHTFIVIEKAFQSAPLELQYLKKKSLCRADIYLAGMYLYRNTGADKVKQAGQKLQMAIRLYPQTLLDKKTQLFVMKWLMMRLLSPKVAKRFTRPAVMSLATVDPRLK